MNTKNYYKRALICSVISICLCVAMLVGTTFAWFTDTTSSENNVIKSGRLAVDLEHKVGDNWVSLKKNADHKVFEETNWVPGYALTENLKIVNDGNLALNYRLTVESDNTEQVYGPYGEDLTDVLDVYIAYGLYSAGKSSELTSNENWKRLGTLTELLAQHHVASGMLLPEGEIPEGTLASGNAVGELTISLALCMQKTAADTYQGLKIGKLFFDLYATQASYESDSFDNTYDKSPYSPLIFDDSKEHQLNTTAILSADHGDNDLVTVLNPGTKVTVTGGYYDAADCGHALIIKNGATVEIKGGAFTFDGNNGCCSDLIHIEGGSTLNITGGTFSADAANATLIYVADKNSKITISGGSFVDWNPADQNGVNYLAEGTALQTVVSGSRTTYIVKPLDDAFIQSGTNTYEVTGDSELMNVPLYRDPSGTGPTVINGNGHTVTISPFEDNTFGWENGTIPLMSTVFGHNDRSLVTVNDITLTGMSHHFTAGFYTRSNQGKHKTEFNNVNIIDFVSYPAIETNQTYKYFANALGVYGTLTLNNCTIKGTTLWEGYYNQEIPVYDIAVTNNSKVYATNCEIGSIFTWEGNIDIILNNTTVDTIFTLTAYNKNYSNKNGIVVNEGSVVNTIIAAPINNYPQLITINAGATVHVLNFSEMRNPSRVKISEDATIGKVIGAGGVEYDTYEEWLAAFNAQKN